MLDFEETGGHAQLVIRGLRTAIPNRREAVAPSVMEARSSGLPRQDPHEDVDLLAVQLRSVVGVVAPSVL
jgi:hypothetical protein